MGRRSWWIGIGFLALVGCSGASNARGGSPQVQSMGLCGGRSGGFASQHRLGLGAQAGSSVPPCPPSPADAPLSIAGITGKVTSPSGRVPLPGARVTLLNPLSVPVGSTTTDGCGRYQFLGIAPGSYQVRYDLRSFSGQGAAEVPVWMAGARVDLGAQPVSFTVGLVQGDQDPIENILDELGIPYTIYQASDLAGYAPYQHRLLVLACGCGCGCGENDQYGDRLRAYVGAGGALYATNLWQPALAAAFPTAIEGSGVGPAGSRVSHVVDPGLAGFLRGTVQVPIEYPVDYLRLATNQPLGTLPLLRDTQTNEPAAVSFPFGLGIVAYSTFYLTAQVDESSKMTLTYLMTRM